MSRRIKLGDKTIDDYSLYFVADIGANHNGSINKAIELIHLAKESGADAAKFQNFKAEKIVSKFGFENLSGKLSHQSKWKKSVYDVYQDASIEDSWTSKLKDACEKAGIEYFTSPYDFESVDAVDPYVNIYKIGSGDISWFDILDYVAKKGKPVLLATGASNLNEVIRAMDILQSSTNQIVLMQCNTNYTGSLENFKYSNLNVLKEFDKRYPDVVLGLSDHTPGHSTVLGSIALGARVIEKHFTDNNNQEGPDHGFAMNPKSWRDMVNRSNELLIALGDGEKRIEENEKQSVIVQRRCLRAVKNLKTGHIIKEHDLIALRPIPKGGLAPYEKNKIVGTALVRDINEGEHFTKHHFQL